MDFNDLQLDMIVAALQVAQGSCERANFPIRANQYRQLREAINDEREAARRRQTIAQWHRTNGDER